MCLLFAIINVYAQKHFATENSGVWEGNLFIYGSLRKPMELKMQLHIVPTDSAGIWKWEIVYLAEGKAPDVRKYKLVTIDSVQGLYAIDELNGIVIEGKYIGSTLITRFSVENSLLLIKYHFTGQSIEFEVISGSENNKTETGNKPSENIPVVYIYKVSNYQKAVLKRL